MRDLPDTRATADPNGSRPSRAIVNMMRMPAVCTASAHTVIAIAEQMRNMSPRVLPSTS